MIGGEWKISEHAAAAPRALLRARLGYRAWYTHSNKAALKVFSHAPISNFELLNEMVQVNR